MFCENPILYSLTFFFSWFDFAKPRSCSWKDVGSHCAMIWQPSSWFPTCRINCNWNPNQINPLFWAKSGCSHLQRHPSYAQLSAEQSSPIVIYEFTYSGLASQTELPLALRDMVSAEASLSFICSPAALLQCATTGHSAEAPGQTVTVHTELDRLSASREEIETDYRITVFSISISLPPGNSIKKISLKQIVISSS